MTMLKEYYFSQKKQLLRPGGQSSFHQNLVLCEAKNAPNSTLALEDLTMFFIP